VAKAEKDAREFTRAPYSVILNCDFGFFGSPRHSIWFISRFVLLGNPEMRPFLVPGRLTGYAGADPEDLIAPLLPAIRYSIKGERCISLPKRADY
jgi:hypothetical protein